MSEHRRAVLLALLVTVLWSSSWVLIRVGLDDEGLAPITFAGLRYSLAAAILFAAVALRHPGSIRTLQRGFLHRLALLGVLYIAVTQGAQFVAIDQQPAATTGLLLAMTPILVAASSSVSLGEAPTSRQVIGAVVVALGAFVYFAGDLGGTAIGLTAAVLGLAANAGSSLLGRAVNRPGTVPPVTVTAVSMAIGAVVLIGVGLAFEGPPTVSARAWAIILWLAAVNTALAFTWWNLSLRELSATESTVINNTMLVEIAVLAWLFLGEAPGWPEAVGIAVVSVGVVLSQLGSLAPTRS